MGVTVEDGSNVSGATSYVTEAEFRDFASLRGIPVPSNDSDISPILVRAADALGMREPCFKGERTYSDQALEWPRSGVRILGEEVPKTVVPNVVKEAQLAYAVAISDGYDPTEPTDGVAIAKETTGPISTSYDTLSGPRYSPVMPLVDKALRLVCKEGGIRFLSTYRA